MGDRIEGVVSPAMLDVAEMLAGSPLSGSFYLAGGTALALQIGHRRSLDLDLFLLDTAEKVPLQTVTRHMEKLFGRERLEPLQRQVDQITWRVLGVQVTFLAYPFPLLYDLVPGESIHARLSNLRLASPGEIALMKAYALGRRAAFRDYVDLYFLLKDAFISLDNLVREAQRKFILDGRPLFQARLFHEQLVYLADVDDVEATLRLLRQPVTRQDVEGFFRREVGALARRQAREAEENR